MSLKMCAFGLLTSSEKETVVNPYHILGSTGIRHEFALHLHRPINPANHLTEVDRFNSSWTSGAAMERCLLSQK